MHSCFTSELYVLGKRVRYTQYVGVWCVITGSLKLHNGKSTYYDNNHLDKNDRFTKIRPLLLLLNEHFKMYAPDEQNHLIDKSMVTYFGKHGAKQFIRGTLFVFFHIFYASLLVSNMQNKKAKISFFCYQGKLFGYG